MLTLFEIKRMVTYWNFVAGSSALHDIYTIWSTAFCCCKGNPPRSSLLEQLLPLLNSGITPFTCDIFSLPNAFYSHRKLKYSYILQWSENCSEYLCEFSIILFPQSTVYLLDMTNQCSKADHKFIFAGSEWNATNRWWCK